jgi:hypothetical protein
MIIPKFTTHSSSEMTASEMTAAAALALARTHRTLEDVVRALGALGWSIVEVVTQDEYTHDVVVAAGDAFLVYDTT